MSAHAPPLRGEVQHRRLVALVVHDGDVLRHAPRREHGELLPVLRDEADARFHGVAGIADAYGPSADEDLPAVPAVRAEDEVHELAAARAHEASEAEDLPRAHLEAHVLDDAAPGEAPKLQLHGSRRHIFLSVEKGGVAAHHLADDRVHVDFRAQESAHALPVLQDRDPVPDLEDLLQVVGDVDDPDPLGLEAADQIHERVRLLQPEGAGRLVHDDDPGLPVTGLHDLQHLLLRRGEVLDHRVFLQVELKGADEIARPLVLRPGIHHQREGRRPLVPEEDVVRHREALDQLRLLVDGGDAELDGLPRREAAVLRPAEHDRARVRCDRAGKDLGQGRLARAVFPDQAVHLPFGKLEGDVVQRLVLAVDFRRVADGRQHLRT